MTAARRWTLVVLGTVLLVLAPVVVAALPARDATVSAVDLLARVRASRSVAFSGYARTRGSVALPSNDVLSGLSSLLGGTSTVRVWWRDPSTWRTSVVRTTGETDVIHHGDGATRWVYESKNVTSVPDVAVRLPTTVDLLPHELARRLLDGSRAGELSRLPATRVAGRDALGLRLVPADRQSSVRRVDVRADRATGLPLRVTVWAKGLPQPVLDSGFVDVHLGAPDPAALRFHPPADGHLRSEVVVDLADAVNRYAARVPPRTLAGLGPRRRAPGLGATGAVGTYGRGPTLLLALPLWSRSAGRVHDDLLRAPGARETKAGVLVGALPLRLLLTEPEPNGTQWLLAGTVTRSALATAATDLAATRPGLRVP